MQHNLTENASADIVKISQKISVDKFLKSLVNGSKKVIISYSVLEHSKNIKLFVETLNKLYQLPELPEIEIIKRGEKPRTIKQDWVDPYIRNLIGHTPSSASRLRVKLLELGAISEDTGIHISELNKNELQLLSKLCEQEHIKMGDELKIYLTKLGESLASGAKKLYE